MMDIVDALERVYWLAADRADQLFDEYEPNVELELNAEALNVVHDFIVNVLSEE